jgi:hypothetical protein
MVFFAKYANDSYKIDDIYKLGYTTVNKPIEEVIYN